MKLIPPSKARIAHVLAHPDFYDSAEEMHAILSECRVEVDAPAPPPEAFPSFTCPGCGKRVGYNADECGGQCRWMMNAPPPEAPGAACRTCKGSGYMDSDQKDIICTSCGGYGHDKPPQSPGAGEREGTAGEGETEAIQVRPVGDGKYGVFLVAPNGGYSGMNRPMSEGDAEYSASRFRATLSKVLDRVAAEARREGERAGMERAAKVLDRKLEAYTREHGLLDPETNVMEYGNGSKAEYAETLAELAADIRAAAGEGNERVGG